MRSGWEQGAARGGVVKPIHWAQEPLAGSPTGLSAPASSYQVILEQEGSCPQGLWLFREGFQGQFHVEPCSGSRST